MRPLGGLVLATAGLLGGQQPSRFADAEVCATCHWNLAAPAGARETGTPDSVAPFALWKGSMMGHSARDPYHRARVRFEVKTTPAAQAIIEDACLRCHAPMQQYELRLAETRMKLDDLSPFGEGGVGCTVCHQISPRGLAARESFEGGFEIGDTRQIFGPHANPFANPMIVWSGYGPAEGRHVLESAMCGACHTVITPVLDAQGKVHGEFVEQAPYLEWLSSDAAANGQSCQSCHVPVVKDAAGRPLPQYIAHQPNGRNFFPPTSPRQPFGLHWFAGGNVPMLGLLAEVFPAESGALEATRAETQRVLSSAMDLRAEARREEDRLEIRIQAINRTGHKLPTAFPSRRIWLHVTVSDASGAKVFESGSWDRTSGEILWIGEFEPHRDRISSPSEVMIWETESEDINGAPVVSLLRSARFRKDNRILPAGFDAEKIRPAGIEPEAIAPAGVGEDEDFRPGSDTVTYRLQAGPSGGPFTVEVEALYQSVKPAHVRVMDAASPGEEKRFADLYSRHNAPAVVARVRVQAK